MPTKDSSHSQSNTTQTLLAQNSTEITYQNMKFFHRMTHKKQRYTTLISFFAFAVFGVYNLTRSTVNIINTVFFFALCIFFGVMHLAYSGFFDTEKQFKQKTYVSGTSQNFYFYQTAFVILLSNGSAPQTTVEYSSLVKVLETDEYFYLYPVKNSAYLVSKQGFTNGTPQTLQKILQAIVPKTNYEIK